MDCGRFHSVVISHSLLQGWSALPSLSFLNCACGTQLKLVCKDDDRIESCICSCGRKLYFLGSLVDLFISTKDTGPMGDRYWVRLPIPR